MDSSSFVRLSLRDQTDILKGQYTHSLSTVVLPEERTEDGRRHVWGFVICHSAPTITTLKIKKLQAVQIWQLKTVSQQFIKLCVQKHFLSCDTQDDFKPIYYPSTCSHSQLAKYVSLVSGPIDPFTADVIKKLHAHFGNKSSGLFQSCR